MRHYPFADFFSSSSQVGQFEALDITGRELDELIDPLQQTEFVSSYFMKKSVFIPAGQREKVTFVTLERFRALLNMAKQMRTPGFCIDAHFRNSPRDELFEIEPRQVGHLLDAGATICATNLHLIDPDLYRLTRALKVQLAFTGKVGVNCYISTDGGGFRSHFDTKTAMVVQLSGRKVWRYAKTASLPYPRRTARERDGMIHLGRAPELPVEDWERVGPSQSDAFDETVMKAGDVLCVPPGTWHEACADGFSLALNIFFQPTDFSALLWPIIAAGLRTRDAWRGGPPPLSGGPPEEPPDTVRAYFRARLSDLRATINAVDENDPRLWSAWYASSTEATQPSSAHTSHRPEGGAYLCVNRTVPFCHYISKSKDGEDCVVLQYGPKRMVFTIGAYPLIRAFVDGKVFPYGGINEDLAGCCSTAEAKQIWDALLAAGIARCVGDPT
ncbi:MAG: hypothetical protein IAE88_05185 [Rhodobacteraceae bacterium]|nr:hypothetical protein [Paracoccaceae bacterium]